MSHNFSLKRKQIRSADPLRTLSIHCLSRCYGLSQLWEQAADPFPRSLSCLVLCVQLSGGEIKPVCSSLLQHVFLNISIRSFSPSQAAFQVGWQNTAHSQRLSRKLVSSVQKHVLTVCDTSGGIFTPKAILFSSNMTQYSWQVLFAHPAEAKHILLKWKQKRSHVRDMLLRAVHLALLKDRSRAIFSHPIQKQKVALWQL